MTEVSENFELVDRPRVTQFSRYPMPPDNGRFQPKHNYMTQYLLPNPSNGRETAYSRATTISKTLDDTYNLDLFVQRKLVAAVLDGVRLQMKMADPKSVFVEATDHEKAIDAAMIRLWGTDTTGRTMNDELNHLDNLTGGADATEFGSAVHAWCEAIDLNLVRPCDVPDVFREHVEAYRQLLRQHGLYPVPDYTERIVMHESDGEVIVGTLDRLFMTITDGKLVLGDVKTTKADSLAWAVLNFCIQLAVYRYAGKMLALDGSGWQKMPALHGDTAYLVHLPNDDHRKSAVIGFDTRFGSAGMKLALAIRDMRRRSKREAATGVIPIPSPEAVEWMTARHELQDAHSQAEMAQIYERYSSVWTPALTELGQQIAGLITTEVGELVP
jgi:hypothetical protein